MSNVSMWSWSKEDIGGFALGRSISLIGHVQYKSNLNCNFLSCGRRRSSSHRHRGERILLNSYYKGTLRIEEPPSFEHALSLYMHNRCGLYYTHDYYNLFTTLFYALQCACTKLRPNLGMDLFMPNERGIFFLVHAPMQNPHLWWTSTVTFHCVFYSCRDLLSSIDFIENRWQVDWMLASNLFIFTVFPLIYGLVSKGKYIYICECMYALIQRSKMRIENENSLFKALHKSRLQFAGVQKIFEIFDSIPLWIQP